MSSPDMKLLLEDFEPLLEEKPKPREKPEPRESPRQTQPVTERDILTGRPVLPVEPHRVIVQPRPSLPSAPPSASTGSPPPERQAGGWTPAFPPAFYERPEIKIPNISEGYPEASELSDELAEREGLEDLAEEIRDWKATVFGIEGDAKLRHTYLSRGRREFGRFGTTSVPLIEDELYLSMVQAQLRFRGLKPTELYTLPVEEQEKIRTAARHAAKIRVRGIIGSSERRGNVVVDLDPEATMERISRGETWAAYIAGGSPNLLRAQARQVLESTGLIGSEDEIPFIDPYFDTANRLLSPFWAILQPGARSVQPQGDIPVVGMQKESKLSWFFRAGAFSVIGAAAFNPNIETRGHTALDRAIGRIWNGWGTEEHIRNIYEGGYDITSEMRNLGEAFGSVVPWAPEWFKTVVGVGGILGLVMVEPDMTLLTMKLAAPLKLIAKGSKATPLLMETVFQPALKTWGRLLDEAGDAALEKWEEIGRSLPPGSPLESLYQAVEAHWTSGLMAKHADLGGERVRSSVQNMKGIVELAESRLASAKRAEDRGLEILRSYGRSVEKSARELGEAEDALLSAKEMRSAVDSLIKLAGEELAMSEAIARVAKARGRSTKAIIDMGHPAAQARFTSRMEKAREAVQRMVDEIAVNAEIFLGKTVTSAEVRKALERGAGLEDLGVSPRILKRYRELTGRVTKLTADAVVYGLAHTYRTMRIARMWGIESLGRVYAAVGKDLPKHFDFLRNPKHLYRVAVMTSKRAGHLAVPAKLAQRVIRGSEAEVAKKTTFLDSAKKNYEAFASEHWRMLEQLLRTMDGRAAVLDSPNSLRAAIGTALKQSELFAKMIRAGTDDVGDFKGAAGVVGKAWRAGEEIGEEGIAKIYSEWVERYGADAVQSALRVHPEASAIVLLDRAEPLKALDVRELIDAERTMFNAAEQLRIQRTSSIPREAVNTIRQSEAVLPLAQRMARWEEWLAQGMRLSARVSRVVDPILSRGLAESPKLVRDVFRRAFERFHSADIDLNKLAQQIATQAKSRGMDVAGSVRAGIYSMLTTSAMFRVGSRMVTVNQGSAPPAKACLDYLKAVSRAAESSRDASIWTSDLTAQALARAAAPTRDASEEGVAAAMKTLRSIVDSADDGAEFLDRVLSAPPLSMLAVQRASDAEDVIHRFVYRGIIHGATQYEAMYDMMRTVGIGIDAQAARALDFVTNRTAGGKVSAAGAEAVEAIMTRYNLPMTQEMSTGRFVGLLKRSKETQNELMEIALSEYRLEIPRFLKEAFDEIPSNLAKELRQYHRRDPFHARIFNDHTRIWRQTVVSGWNIPRIANFAGTYFGDWSQLVLRVGLIPATRITAAHAFSHVPFVGERLSNQLSEWARGNSFLAAMFNPHLSPVLRGADDVILETGDGPVSAKQALRWSQEDGMFDALVSADLNDILNRVRPERWQKNGLLEFIRRQPERPSRLVRNTTELMENLQHRIRLQTYLEAMTGKLTGTPMTREAAKRLVLDTLYDWRLGVPTWEAETIARVAAFWTYRRQMLRQMGSAVVEGLTGRESNYLWKAITGNTPLGRVRKMGALVQAIPEAVYWTDPDAEVDDEIQLLEWGRRQVPWWVDMQPVLFSRRLGDSRELWYSEVARTPVTFETVMLPSLTTLDALYMMHLVSSTGMASAIYAGHQVGLEPSMTADRVENLWERAVDEGADFFGPGTHTLIRNALRPLLGGAAPESIRGIPVPAHTAAMLHQLGWGEFLATYEDKDGRLRYAADGNALATVARIISLYPPIEEISRNWMHVNNPGMREGMVTGITEFLARFTGLVRYAGFDPSKQLEWEIRGEEEELKREHARIRAMGGEI